MPAVFGIRETAAYCELNWGELNMVIAASCCRNLRRAKASQVCGPEVRIDEVGSKWPLPSALGNQPVKEQRKPDFPAVTKEAIRRRGVQVPTSQPMERVR